MMRVLGLVLALIVARPAAACPSGQSWLAFDAGSSWFAPRLHEHGGRAIAAIGPVADLILMQVDGEALQAWGTRLEGRLQRGAIAAVADVAIYNATAAEPGPRGTPGTLQRVSAALRWEPAAWRMDSSAVLSPFLELGVGEQRWTFADAPARGRRDVTAGFGMHVHGGSTDPSQRRHLGVTMLVRVIAAPGSEAPGGAISRRTEPAPERRELGVELGLGFTWGRRGR